MTGEGQGHGQDEDWLRRMPPGTTVSPIIPMDLEGADVCWRQLDDRAREWARNWLREGHRLGQASLPLVAESEPWGHLPAASDDLLNDLDRGSQNREELARENPNWLQVGNANPEFAFTSFMNGDTHDSLPLIVWEDRHGTPDTPYVIEELPQGRLRTSDQDDVYELWTADNYPENLCDPGFYPSIGLATRWPSRLGPIQDLQTVTDSVISTWVGESLAIILGAWDEENYLFLDRGFLAEIGADTA